MKLQRNRGLLILVAISVMGALMPVKFPSFVYDICIRFYNSDGSPNTMTRNLCAPDFAMNYARNHGYASCEQDEIYYGNLTCWTKWRPMLYWVVEGLLTE